MCNWQRTNRIAQRRYISLLLPGWLLEPAVNQYSLKLLSKPTFQDFKIRTETTLHLGTRAQMADEDKRAARKRKHLADMDEFRSFRQGHGSGKGQWIQWRQRFRRKRENQKQSSVRNTHMLLVGFGHRNLWKASSRSRMCKSGQTCTQMQEVPVAFTPETLLATNRPGVKTTEPCRSQCVGLKRVFFLKVLSRFWTRSFSQVTHRLFVIGCGDTFVLCHCSMMESARDGIVMYSVSPPLGGLWRW